MVKETVEKKLVCVAVWNYKCPGVNETLVDKWIRQFASHALI